VSTAGETFGERAVARFATADGSLAIEVVHHTNEMFAITLRIDGRNLGDGEPEASPQTLRGLGNIAAALDPAIDPRLSPVALQAVLSDDANNDRHLVHLGEGFDRLGIRGFVRDGQAYLVVEDFEEKPPRRPGIYAVHADELTTVVARATAFYDANVERPPRS
jgi:hypothetical protein